MNWRLLFLLTMAVLLAACGRVKSTNGRTLLRVGHFPNITHAQAVIAHQLSRQGKGWFEERLGPEVELQWFVYNAGPSAMEALFANSIDLAYVGPGPALNAYTRAGGEEVRVVAGVTRGGAALVVAGDGPLHAAEDFRGKKIATPQLGNTQDIACRAWLTRHGLKVTRSGGDAQILPTDNPDQLALFQSKQVDAVWTVEPWVSRLELQAGGRVLVEQKDDFGTVLVSSVVLGKEHPELLQKFTKAHAELTKWVAEHPAEAKALLRAELLEETKREISAELVDHAWPRLRFDSSIDRKPFDAMLSDAQSAGFLNDAPPLDRLVVPQP